MPSAPHEERCADLYARICEASAVCSSPAEATRAAADRTFLVALLTDDEVLGDEDDAVASVCAKIQRKTLAQLAACLAQLTACFAQMHGTPTVGVGVGVESAVLAAYAARCNYDTHMPIVFVTGSDSHNEISIAMMLVARGVACGDAGRP